MTELLEILDKRPRITPAEPVFEEKYDLIVVGCGTAGCVALLTAAKRGRRVLGIERMSVPGGTMTETGIIDYYFGSPGGIYEEIDRNTESFSPDVFGKVSLHTDARKESISELFRRHGVSVLYDSTLCGVYREGRRITGLSVFSRGRLRSIGAEGVIDATGEGILLSLAGCQTSYGRESDGTCVPFSLIESDLFSSRNCTVIMNPDSGKTDCRDGEVFSKTVLYAQSEYARHIPGLRKLRLQSMPGIREGRLLQGEQTLTAEALLQGKRCDDPVFYAYADLDKHGGDLAFDSPLFRKWHILANLGAINLSVPVPMGVLVTREYDNLAVAGRCLSVDHEMQTCLRMNRDMQKTGEVAATALDLALSMGIPLREVPYGVLAPILRSTGCLDEKNDRGPWYDGKSPDPHYVRPVQWPAGPAETDKALSGLCPGAAIWAAAHGDAQMAAHLWENLSCTDENLRDHSAFALAIREDPACGEVLLSILKKRDRTFLSDLRKRNKSRLSMAICGLGMLGFLPAVPLLEELLTDPEEHTHYDTVFGLRADYYSVLSYAAAALTEIARAHPEESPRIVSFLRAFFRDESFIARFCDGDPRSVGYSLGRELKASVLHRCEESEKRKK